MNRAFSWGASDRLQDQLDDGIGDYIGGTNERVSPWQPRHGLSASSDDR